MSRDDFVTVGEAARILGRHENTVRDYERSGLLPRARRQPLTINRLWDRSAVEELAKRLTIPAEEPVSV